MRLHHKHTPTPWEMVELLFRAYPWHCGTILALVLAGLLYPLWRW